MINSPFPSECSALTTTLGCLDKNSIPRMDGLGGIWLALAGARGCDQNLVESAARPFFSHSLTQPRTGGAHSRGKDPVVQVSRAL